MKMSYMKRNNYTNCVSAQKHAEDFFKEDVEKGELKKKIAENPEGTITMYFTLQPCNRSTSTAGTRGTPPNKSCCDTLVRVKRKYLGEVRLHIKVTHTNRLSTSTANRNEEILRQNAENGIKKLKGALIDISAMNQKDWDYLSSMTMKKPRDELDDEIRRVLENI